MAKGYWIGRVDIRVPERYHEYVSAAKHAFELYGATFLARGGRTEAAEGPARARNVLIEFDSFEAAQACYHSAEYQRAAAIRQEIADSDIVLVEGV